MKNNTLADFFFPLNPKFVEDDKSKIKRLEQELKKYKMDNERLTKKYENVQSENFALKVQLREYSLQNVTTKKSFPSFAEVAIKPLSDTNQSFSRTMPKSPPQKVKTSEPFVKLHPIPPVSQSKLSQHYDSIHPEISQNYAKPMKPKQELPSNNQSKTSKSIPLFAEKNSFEKKQNPKKSSFTHPPYNSYNKNNQSAPHQNVIIYHDSNLAWSQTSTIEQAVKNINTYRPHPINNVRVTKCYTPRLEDTLRAIRSTDHTNSIVILSVMTNNANAYQSVSHSTSLLKNVVDYLKNETYAQNIIVLESPPSRRFNIFPFNKAMFDLCHSMGVFFARNLLKQNHLKTDGLHILNHYKHLMIKSVAAAIKKVDPKQYYRFPNNWYIS